jgi:predicted DNA-binding WGR domain protein
MLKKFQKISKSATPKKEDFETFREKMLMLALNDAPEPAPKISPMTSSSEIESVKTIKLYYTNPVKNSDKVYTLAIVKESKYTDAYYVNFSYGKRNKHMTEGTKTKIAVSYKEALNIFNTFITEKQQEGYTTNVNGSPHSGVIRP